MAERGFDRAVPKRKYRERHQPQARKEFGYLEKHKDYAARARDFHEKEAQLSTLREQAYTRNPEEFYFKMVHSRLQDGIHTEFEPAVDDITQKKRKGKDGNVLLMRTQSERNKLERLKGGLHLLDEDISNTHVVFVKDQKELEEFQPQLYFDTDKALLKRKNRLKTKQLQQETIQDHAEINEKTDYEVYEETANTAETLTQLLAEVEKDKMLLSKERKTLIDPEKRIYKFFRERKR